MLRRCARILARTDSATASKPVVCCVDEFAVLEAVAQDDVQHSHQQRRDRCRDAAGGYRSALRVIGVMRGSATISCRRCRGTRQM